MDPVPRTRLILFREQDGSIPVLDWLANLGAKARDKCRVRMERLGELGHELRRPEADYLRNGIYELRASLAGSQYRILYSNGIQRNTRMRRRCNA